MYANKGPRGGWFSSPKNGWGLALAIILVLILSAVSFTMVQAGTHSEFNAYMLPRPLSATTYENVLILRRHVKKVSATTVHIVWDNNQTTNTSFSPTTSGGSEYLYLPVPVGVKAATVTIVEGQYQVTFDPKLPENSEFTVKVVQSSNFPYPSRNVVEIYRRVLISATAQITVVTTPHSQQTGQFEAIAPLFESQTRYMQLPDNATAVTVTIEEAGKTFVYPLPVNPILPTPTPTATQTPEPTATTTATPTIVPTTAPTLASSFVMTVPSSVNAGEIFTATAELDSREALTGEAQILISVSQDLMGLTPLIAVSGTNSTEELGITYQHLTGIFPPFKCGQPQSAETNGFTVLAIKIAHAEKLQTGDSILVSAPFKAVSQNGIALSSPVWVNGAFLATGEDGDCIMLAVLTEEVKVVQPGALIQLTFLPIINR